MAGPITGGRNTYVYLSDNTLSYTTVLSSPKAAAGNFGFGAVSGGQRPSTMRMRHVRGVIVGSGGANTAPATIKLYVASPTDPLMTGSTTSFTVTYPWGSETYLVTGIFGEQRIRLAAA